MKCRRAKVVAMTMAIVACVLLVGVPFHQLSQARLDYALLKAVRNEDDRGCLVALTNGADPFSISLIDDSDEPLWKYCLARIERKNAKNGAHALEAAFWHQSFHVASALLASGARPDNAPVNNHGITELSYASREGYTDLVRLLLRAGADPRAKDEYGETALSYAKENGHADIVAMLHKAGVVN